MVEARSHRSYACLTGAWASLLLVIVAPAVSQNFKSAFALGGEGTDFIRHVVVGTSGDVYVTGSFEDTVDFQPGSGSHTLTSVEDRDTFLARYDTSGVLAWVVATPGSSFHSALALDSFESVFLSSCTDSFLAKYDAGGARLWELDLGGKACATSIAPDLSGDVVVAGFFRGTVDFDPGSGTHELTSDPLSDAHDTFVARYDAHGALLWAFRIEPASNMQARVATHPSGDILLAGYYSDTVDLDPGPNQHVLTSSNQDDAYLARYDASGGFKSAFSVGGSARSDLGTGILVDGNGDYYWTSSFEGTADLDPGPDTFNVTIFVDTSFLAKYDEDGNLLWAFALEGDTAGFSSIALDGEGSVYVGGVLDEFADFDPGPGTFILTSPGTESDFVAKYSSEGAFRWAFSILINDFEEPSVAVDAAGTVSLGGGFVQTTDFDPGTEVFELTPLGPDDGFIAQYSQDQCTYGPADQPFLVRRGKGKPEMAVFSWTSCGGAGRLAVTNHGVDSAVFELNGEVVLAPSDFRRSATSIDVDVILNEGSNVLEVELRSTPGGYVEVEFFSE